MQFRTARAETMVLIEKRGRMLRRARKFGRPEFYYKTFFFSCQVAGDPIDVSFEVDPVKQRIRPILSCQGQAYVANQFVSAI